MIQISLQKISQKIFIPLTNERLIYIEKSLLRRRCLIENFHMMRKTDRQKLVQIEIGSHGC